MAQKTPNKELTLDEKVKIIQSDKIKSQRNLAVEYGVSKSQVQRILKRKAEIMTAYEENAPIRKKRFKVQENQKIDEMTWSWFSRVRALNCAVSGPMIKEHAMEFARSLEVPEVDFTASNGWLSRFKARHNINSAKIPGESASVPQEAVDNWTKRVPTIIARYDPKDIFNLDESGIYHAMPDRTLRVKGTECKGRKQSKERLTAAFLVNMVGEFQKTLIIGKSAKPRCFRNLDKHSLPVIWRSNKKAWMTSGLFKEWMQLFNKKMQRQQRNVIVFLDNATCHPDLELSNVEFVFFPPNTTSRLQPLDRGIFRAIKAMYRKQLVRTVLAKMDCCQPGDTDAMNDLNKKRILRYRAAGGSKSLG